MSPAGLQAPGATRPLTVAECRRILGPACTASDEEIRANLDRLRLLARALLQLRED